MSQESSDWRPTASIANIKARAEMNQTIREFFANRGLLEVETPLMCQFAVTDPFINAFKVENYYLQTSPEYAMKRMLAAGIGSCYQICKAFRQEEIGSLHNLEFTMLEWYHLGVDDFALMEEVGALLQAVLNCGEPKLISYQELFQEHLGVDPHSCKLADLQQLLTNNQIEIIASDGQLSKDDYLMLVFSEILEPKLVGPRPWIIYNYPATQAALAQKPVRDGIEVAARFEVYMEGVELANAYYELIDPKEQSQRFKADQQYRIDNNLVAMAADHKVLSALEHGMPSCAGIALGLDRLLMLKTKAKTIAEVLSFDALHA